MPGKKCKVVTNVKEVAVYREKFRKRPSPPPLKLTNKERQKFTFQSPFSQTFSLPSNIIYYISRNPSSPKGHLKLLFTCKSILQISRILPVKTLEHYVGNDFKTWHVNRVTVSLDNEIFNFIKIWINIGLWISSGTLPNLASTLVKRNYKFSLKNLRLENQVLTFKELQVLVSGDQLESVRFMSNVFKNDDGSTTEFEKVFQLFSVKDFIITFHLEHHGIGKNTTKKIIEILSSDQVPREQDIWFCSLPESFDISSFFEFLKANMTGRQHSFHISFADGLSDAYKNRLQQFVNQIIQIRGIYSHTVPMINFPGQDEEALKELHKMRYGIVVGILKKPGALYLHKSAPGSSTVKYPLMKGHFLYKVITNIYVRIIK